MMSRKLVLAVALALAAALVVSLPRILSKTLEDRPGDAPASRPPAGEPVSAGGSEAGSPSPLVQSEVVGGGRGPAGVSPGTASEVPGDSRSADPSGDQASQHLAARLRAAQETFFGEDPDVFGLQQALGELGRRARVDPGSVHVDPHGVTHGTLSLPGTDVAGTFTLDGGGVSVTLPIADLGPEGLPAIGGETTFGFDVDGGAPAGVHETVQSHPDLGAPGLGAYVGEGASIVGWTLGAGSEGIEATALTIQAAGKGWRIGRSPEVGLRTLAGADDAGAMHAWMQLLAPLATAGER